MIWSIVEYWLRIIDILTVLLANGAAFLQAVYEIGTDDGRRQRREKQQQHQRRLGRQGDTMTTATQLPQQQEWGQQDEEQQDPYCNYRRHRGSTSPQLQQRYHHYRSSTATTETATATVRRRRRLAALHKHHSQKHQQPNHIDTLPNEILTVVFEMTASPRHLYQCTLVSHRWHALVTPILWRAPVLTGPVCCFPPFVKNSTLTTTTPCDHYHSSPHSSSPSLVLADSTFPIHLAKYGSAIRKLVLPPQHTTDCSMAHISRSCPNLQDLCVDGCKRVSNLGLLFLTRHCRKLERLSMNRCILIDDQGLSYLTSSQQKLAEIHMAGLKQVTSRGVTQLAQGLPHLHALDVSDCTGVTEVRELMRACGTKLTYLQLNRLSSSLLTNNNANNNNNNDVTDLIVQHCPNITHLGIARRKLKRVSSSSMATDRQLNDLIDSLERHNIVLTRLGANLMRRHRQRRRYQQKHDVHELDQQQFLQLVRGLKHLQYLDVSNWDVLEDDWVKNAVTGLKITHVRLSGCRHVTTTSTNTNTSFTALPKDNDNLSKTATAITTA
ncbi:hypothetical protein BDB00DRAFT_813808 [Zychaea mexicana]|uniref:uncharacterized protein n=1 Tax=Zychaea mexicana TaxID=64656 RepID=UPI0022FEB04A|nr:uncharacterized protein BDB00DRAFT_813808 [Zychaea mexicana]KAI9495558.1 hypothetical protein BDB00DRAFT_813808 [Zychaea mexicana]